MHGALAKIFRPISGQQSPKEGWLGGKPEVRLQTVMSESLEHGGNKKKNLHRPLIWPSGLCYNRDMEQKDAQERCWWCGFFKPEGNLRTYKLRNGRNFGAGAYGLNKRDLGVPVVIMHEECAATGNVANLNPYVLVEEVEEQA